MKHASLFSGIGGFDLAAEWMGWENIFHCEWNEFGQKVLKYYWPNAISYGDIKTTDFTVHRGQIDILTGGFPCQPYSHAGKRLGKDDDRHLWPQMLRAIREIQPCYIVGENVYGLVNWNGGLVFNEVQADLEAEGYEVQPVILPACGINAPHRRERIWFVAHSNRIRCERTEKPEKGQQGETFGNIDTCDIQRTNADPNYKRLQRGQIGQESERGEKSNDEQFTGCDKFYRQNWEKFPTQSPVRGGNDGIPKKLDSIAFYDNEGKRSNWNKESIKAYGNAIVPQIAYEIFKVIDVIQHIK